MTDVPDRAWLGVAHAEHAGDARTLGIAQLNHGKRHNLARLHRGDGLVYYSPRDRIGGVPLRAFTALGTLADDEPFLADVPTAMGAHGTFRPWRRRVTYLPGTPVPLAAIGTSLTVTTSADWRHNLRFGLIPLPVDDFLLLRAAWRAADGESVRHGSR